MKNRPVLAARSVLALAALAALSTAAPYAQALGVGRLNVQSALGEGMRAEIDITSLSPDEAASLAVRIASPGAYRAAGVDYNAVLAGTQVTVLRRADGQAFLRLSSDRAVQEPFIELIVEMSWASGRLVREFTLLFDPPGNRPAPSVQAAAPVAPVMAAAPPAPPAPPAQSSTGPGALIQPGPQPARAARAPAPVAAAPIAAALAPAAGTAVKPATPLRRSAANTAANTAANPPSSAAPGAAAAATAPVSAAGKRYPVRPGDTLYRVAGRTQPAGVSLDQMLVGLYRANPEAFIANNVNRLRAGLVLSVPTADEVRDVTPSDLRQLITAQSVDFSAYRSRLAQAAPLAQAQEPARQAQGKVQAAVDDRKQSAAASPDKLKLSGAASASAAQAAQAAERRDNAARVAELTRNLEALKKLQQGTAGAQAPAAVVPSVTPPVIAPPAAAPPVAAAIPPAAVPALAAPLAGAAPDAAVAGVAAPSGVGPAVKKPVAALPVAAPPAAAAPEAGLLDSLSGQPWLLPGAGVLALALAGLAVWRLRGRSRVRKGVSETSFLESRMQPDSFFGASGGQHVDTRDATRSGASSMGYSLSQLDAIGDVDPVAEADVYLAYGRDLQAEEILKEAMRTTPERLAVRTKLLEVYAKRRDSKAFELLATQLYALTRGVGIDWARAQELGSQFEPDNPLYQPGGHPEEIILDGERVVVEPLGATTQPHSILSSATPPAEELRLPQIGGGTMSLGLDLDLDFDEPHDSPSVHAMDATRPLAPSLQRPADLGLDFDFEDSGPPIIKPGVPELRRVSGAMALGPRALDFDDDKGSTVSSTTVAGGGGGDTSLDFSQFPMSEPDSLGEATPTTPGTLDDVLIEGGDPLTRKLELAEEFRQIGDIDGARDLLEEVVSKAAGTLRAKAQTLLDALA